MINSVQRIRPIVPNSGETIVRLMRKHHVTIRELKDRMGITIKRIRYVREHGTDCLCLRDWIQAITETDPGNLEYKRVAVRCGVLLIG